MPPIERIHHLLEKRAAHAPRVIALADTGTGALSYEQFAETSQQAATTLRAAGLTPGQRLLIVAENCNALPVLLMAASRCDAWAIPVNARLSAAEISRIRNHATPALTVFTHEVSPAADAHADPGAAQPVSLGGFNRACL
jgi:acyl-CoA synthetase (AMP-forming)/AMP-acid ligase II